MFVEHFKKAWSAYRKNFCDLVGANLIALVILYFFMISAVLVAIIPVIGSIAQAQTFTMDTVINYLLSSGLGYLAIAAVIAVMGFAIYIILSTALIRVAGDAVKGRAHWRDMFKVARARWLSILGVSILTTVLSLLCFAPMLLLLVAGLAQSAWLTVLLAISAGIAGFLLAILFVFAPYAVVLDGVNAVTGLRKSIAFVRKSYFEVLLLFVLLAFIAIVASFVLTLIPFLGGALTTVLITPYILLVLTSYYKKRR